MSSVLLSTRDSGVVVPPPSGGTGGTGGGVSDPGSGAPPPLAPITDPRVRRMTLVSVDGSTQIPLDGTDGWWRMDGATGLGMTPVDVVTDAAPGVAGSILRDVRPVERQVFIPIVHVSWSGRIAHHTMLERLRLLVDPYYGQFRIVCASEFGERELSVVYREGLEGSEGRSEQGAYWRKLGISALAVDPHPRARADRTVPFNAPAAGSGDIFLTRSSDTAGIAPWPRALSAGGVLGSDMTVTVASQVPVWPTLELTGPVSSCSIESDSGLSLSIPAGIPAGSTLRVVMDPRGRSIRLDDELAASRVARGSVLRPLRPGVNVLDVAAPGAGQGTRVALTWRDGFRSLW